VDAKTIEEKLRENCVFSRFHKITHPCPHLDYSVIRGKTKLYNKEIWPPF
jgi:hypothetical protein